jgi:hypothetical protein
MKKYLFLILFAVVCCDMLSAQEDSEGFVIYTRDYRISLGPKVGVGLSTASRSRQYSLSFGSGVAYQFGAAFNAHFGRRYEHSEGGTGLFGVQVEALYERRGLRLDSERFGLSQIEFPILFQIYPIPQLGIGVGTTIVKVVGASPDKIQSGNLVFHTGEIKGGDFMLTLAANYELSMGLVFDLRYNLGLSKVASNLDSRVSTFMFSLSYLFSIVK